MSLDQYIAIISSIATWVTAVAVWLTVKEMSKQRKEMAVQTKNQYKPHLVFPDITFFAKETKPDSKEFIWGREEKNKDKNLTGFKIDIRNEGKGTAKNIILKYSMDFEDIINKINELSQKKHQNVYVELKGSLLEISYEKDRSITVMLSNILHDKIDYLSSAGVGNNQTSISLPMAYTQLVSLYYKLITANGRESQEDEENIFSNIENIPLAIELEFTDVENDIYKLVYLCHSSPMILDNNNDGTGMVFNGKIIFQESQLADEEIN